MAFVSLALRVQDDELSSINSSPQSQDGLATSYRINQSLQTNICRFYTEIYKVYAVACFTVECWSDNPLLMSGMTLQVPIQAGGGLLSL